MPATALAAPASPQHQATSPTSPHKPGTRFVTPNGQYCYPGGSYTGVNKVYQGTPTKDSYTVADGWFHSVNTSPYLVDMTFTETRTTTVQIQVSVSVTVDASAILSGASATASLGLTASETTSANIGTIVHNVPPNGQVYAAYVAWQDVTTGDYTYYYSNCTWHDYGVITITIPDGEGWYIR